MPPMSESPPIRGHVWFVYPDPARGLPAGEPFATSEEDTLPPGVLRRPPGVIDFWTVPEETPGLQNALTGHSYLVLTERLERPDVVAGWFVEPARLRPDFQIDQRGARWLRLGRVLRTSETESGPVQECEFQVVKD